jgi:parvulin-like peptidyl-prolyl isomerase
MKRSLVTLAALAASFGLAATGCGGGSDEVSSGSVAVVDGTEIPRSDLDRLMEQAKASYESQKQDFPKVGTPEYQQVQQQYVAFLVQKTEFEQAAEELELKITDADVDKARKRLLDDRFDGDEKKLADALEQQGLTEESFRETLRVSVLAEKIYNEVTKDVKVTDADALTTYTQNQDSYRTPESRQVRHILISKKDSSGQVDYAKSKTEADRVYGLLQDGGDFAALAKQYSADTASAATGGKYLANRGQSVPEFDKAAFELKTNEISKPVKTQYGYHVIQALEDAKPAKVTSFEKVKASIKATLLQDKKSTKMTEWVQELQKDYEDRISYASGFAPPDIPDPTETQNQ